MGNTVVEAFPCKCGANHWILRPSDGSLFQEPVHVQRTLMDPIKAVCLMFNEKGGFARFQLANCGRCQVATVVPWDQGNIEVRDRRFYFDGREL